MPCPHQIAAETLSSGSVIRVANASFKASIPSPLAAEVGSIWSFGNLSCSAFRFSFAPGKSILLATTSHARDDRVGSDATRLVSFFLSACASAFEDENEDEDGDENEDEAEEEAEEEEEVDEGDTESG